MPCFCYMLQVRTMETPDKVFLMNHFILGKEWKRRNVVFFLFTKFLFDLVTFTLIVFFSLIVLWHYYHRTAIINVYNISGISHFSDGKLNYNLPLVVVIVVGWA